MDQEKDLQSGKEAQWQAIVDYDIPIEEEKGQGETGGRKGRGLSPLEEEKG